MKDLDKTRCFIALDLPREVINRIKEIQETIKKKNFFYGKFTEPENLHLTLKFLGEISEQEIGEVKKRLQKINLKEFEASLGELGVFSKEFIRIIWVKLQGEGLWKLQEEIDNILGGLFVSEKRFMGHITLARVKKIINKQELIDYLKNIKIKNLRFKVDRFFLKKSELFSEGPVYNDIEKYTLQS